MKLYIQIENGQPINHPAFEDNLMQAFHQIPAHWEEFVRIERPVPGVYQVVSDAPTYEKVNGVWTDVWVVRGMTDAEKAAKQQATRDAFNAREQASNWSAWTLDEATCTMVPPIPRPDTAEDVQMFWCGADNAWKEAPPYSYEGGPYKFDFFAWNWVPV